MQQPASSSAVSEIVGTMLLLSIVVGVFGLLYLGVASYDFPDEPTPIHISASIQGPNLVVEHRGGDSIETTSKIVLSIGGNESEIIIDDVLNATERADGYWSIGETVVYPIGDVAFMQVTAKIIDSKNDQIVLSGTLQEGEVNDMIVTTLDATEITPASAKLRMNYNFRNRTGDYRFAYREYTGAWQYTSWINGQTGSGYYEETINGLNPTLYNYIAQLRYCLNITEGENKSFIYTGTQLDDITPYFIFAQPQTITAQGSALLQNVELWYQFSLDNTTWSTNWWDSDWGARRPINLNVSAGSIPSDSQVLLNISFEPQMNWDFSDLRFVSYMDNITEYPYWIENKTDGERAFVWVRIDQSVVPQNQSLVWMYYNNSDATTASDGYATFFFFDDFEGIVLDVDWTANSADYAITDNTLWIGEGTISTTFPLTIDFNDGYVLESRIKYHETTGNISGGLAASSDPSPQVNNNGGDAISLIHRPAASTDLQRLIARGSTTGFDCGSSSFSTQDNNQWYILGQHFYTGGVVIKTNRSDEWPFGCGWIQDMDQIVLGAYHTQTTYDIQDTSYDWVIVRRYLSSEPTQYIGDTEFVGWHRWKDNSNPDTTAPWSWDFDYPEGAGFYEFYSIGTYDTLEETPPTTEDTNCLYYPLNTPDAITQNPVVFLGLVNGIMSYDFKDFIWGYVCFAFREQGAPKWEYTPWVGRIGAGNHNYLGKLSIFKIYEYKAQLYYTGGLVEGNIITFSPLTGVI